MSWQQILWRASMVLVAAGSMAYMVALGYLFGLWALAAAPLQGTWLASYFRRSWHYDPRSGR